MVVLPQSVWEDVTEKLNHLTRILSTEETAKESSSEWIPSVKARQIIGVSQKTWQTYRDNGVIPFSQFGRKIYVKKSDLEKFMEDHYINKKR